MSESSKRSRINKYEKRRKNNKAITILFIIAILLAVALIWIIAIGKDNNSKNGQEEQSSGQLTFTEREDTNNNDELADQNENVTEKENEDNDAENNKEDSDSTKENAEVETTSVDSSDPNVIEAYTGNWNALGTEQEGPHTTVYDNGSADRIEIKQAVLSVTGLSEDDFTEHWVGNGGEQKVISTVSNKDNTEIYRVYLSWIDGEGWEPEKVEKLHNVSR